MDEYTKNVNELMQKQIDDLRSEIDSLKSSTKIPLAIDQALQGRGFVKAIGVQGVPTSSGTVGVANTQTIVTSGPTATVPAQPSGTISITIKGVIYNLLFQ